MIWSYVLHEVCIARRAMDVCLKVEGFDDYVITEMINMLCNE